MGYTDARIMLRHLLPNAITPVLVYWMTDMALAILLGSSLGYLGLGAQPPAAEWGVLIADGKNFMTHRLVDLDLPRHRDRAHRPRLQPARRRPRRPPAADAVMRRDAPLLEVRGPARRSFATPRGDAHRRRRRRPRAAPGRGAGARRRIRAPARASPCARILRPRPPAGPRRRARRAGAGATSSAMPERELRARARRARSP